MPELAFAQLYTRDDKLYVIVDCHTEEKPLLCKAPSDANWHTAVAYQEEGNFENPILVRTCEDFLEKYHYAGEVGKQINDTGSE